MCLKYSDGEMKDLDIYSISGSCWAAKSTTAKRLAEFYTCKGLKTNEHSIALSVDPIMLACYPQSPKLSRSVFNRTFESVDEVLSHYVQTENERTAKELITESVNHVNPEVENLLELFMSGRVGPEQLRELQGKGIIHGGVPYQSPASVFVDWTATPYLKNIHEGSKKTFALSPDFELLPDIIAKGRERVGLNDDNQTSIDTLKMRHRVIYPMAIDGRIDHERKATYDDRLVDEIIGLCNSR